MKIGIIICDRYHTCGGGKCFRAIRERTGGFAHYPKEELIEVVGYSTCGGCPGGNVEYVPEEMIKNGAEAIHLATGLVVGYPPCPRIAYAGIEHEAGPLFQQDRRLHQHLEQTADEHTHCDAGDRLFEVRGEPKGAENDADVERGGYEGGDGKVP